MAHTTARLLQERYRLESGEAEHILGSFVDAVENSLEEYGICHVAGIGTFVRVPGERRISFEPSESLGRAVNVRFADLPVYEVDPGDAPRRDVAVPVGRDAHASSPPGEAGESRTDGIDAESGETADRDAGSVTTSSEPMDETAHDVGAEAVRTATGSDQEAAEVGREISEEAIETHPTAAAEDTVGKSPVPTARVPLAKSRGPRSGDRDPSGTRKAVWIGLPLLVAVIAAIAWFVQRPVSISEPPARESAEQTPPADAGAAAADQPPVATADTVAGADDDETDINDGTFSDESAESEPTPASGDIRAPAYPLDRSMDGYTMIVGSSPDPAAADEQMSRYSELELPYGVLDYSEEESAVYRLALGLFDSAQQADSARQAMADVLPSGTWVWRIR